VPLEPALASPDAPLQGPRGVREVQGERADGRFGRHAVQHRVRREHGQGHAQRVAADVAQEHPGAERIPGQESERTGGDRGARGDQEGVAAPCSEVGVGHATDQGMRGGDTVDAVHEVKHVDDPGDPDGTDSGEDRESGQRGLHQADEQAGHDDAGRALKCDPLADRQPVQILGQPDRGEDDDRDTERRRRRTAQQQGGHDQPGSDGEAPAARCRHRVRRPQAGNVDRGRPPQQRDRRGLGDGHNGAGWQGGEYSDHCRGRPCLAAVDAVAESPFGCTVLPETGPPGNGVAAAWSPYAYPVP
jgi:hypothetical protein